MHFKMSWSYLQHVARQGEDWEVSGEEKFMKPCQNSLAPNQTQTNKPVAEDQAQSKLGEKLSNYFPI